ncbi:MAG: protein translocase subunit SecF [Kiloniellales bacterium]
MRLISLVPTDTKVDFIGRRMIAYAFSGLLLLASAGSLVTQGLNLGIDFLGGILIEVRTSDGAPADLAALRFELGRLGLGEVALQEFGQPSDVLIRVQKQAGGEQAQQAAVQMVKAALGQAVEYRRTEFVGPKVGAELKRAALWAVLAAITVILLYIWFRFEWQFGVGAVIALVHDVVTTVGLFSIFQLEFNLATVAAILTIAGYSINDTVVVYDRVRENFRKYKKLALPGLLNLSVNQTLSRTLLTSLTTLLALGALYVFGGAVIRGFTVALIWGVVIGTYSSIFIAVSLLLLLEPRRGVAAGEDETAGPVRGPAS